MAFVPRHVTTKLFDSFIAKVRCSHVLVARLIALLLPCEMLNTDKHCALTFELTDAEHPKAIILLGRVCGHDVELLRIVANGDFDEAVSV